MKKIIWLAVVMVTVYLNIMYKWSAGMQVLAAELIFPAICIVIAFLAGRKIEVRIVITKDMAEQGEEIPVHIEVTNKSFLPAAVNVVCYSQYLSERKQKKKVYKVYADGKKPVKRECMVKAEQCGRMRLGIVEVKVYDCWRFFSVSKRSYEDKTITVMPKPYPVNLVVSSRTKWFPIDGESYAQDRSGEDNAEVYEVREYRAGDRMQKVHWKLSAKEEEIYIKEFSYPVGAAVVVLLEGSGSGRKKSGAGNQFIEAVVSIAMALLEKECAHYIVWRKKSEGKTERKLLRNEEDFYEFLMELLSFEADSLDTDMEEHYRYEYKGATYSTILKITESLKLQVNGEMAMDMQEKGMETFFETMEIVV